MCFQSQAADLHFITPQQLPQTYNLIQYFDGCQASAQNKTHTHVK